MTLGLLEAAPRLDLEQRTLYFPVRHHSPACARQLQRLIESWRPEVIMVEGPRDAEPLIEFLLDPETRCPVAIYSSFVDRRGPHTARHAAYYPFCDYSPELVALRVGRAQGAELRFIDLALAEQVWLHPDRPESLTASLQDEGFLVHSQVLQAACRRTGARDHDDLWDHLFEVGDPNLGVTEFVDQVLTYCALARCGASREQLQADGTLAREQAMAWAIARETRRTLVVTGGFHSLALPTTEPQAPPGLKSRPEDRLTTLMAYSFPQLDRLNGYASGMPSPAFYQSLWEGRTTPELLVDLGRQLRGHSPHCSTADLVAAVSLATNLSTFRGHPQPSREDVLDGIRGALVKGHFDTDGCALLALARVHLAGRRVGQVTPRVGLTPLQRNLRHLAQELKLELESYEPRQLSLDLYRSHLDRRRSRFFHRLAFLELGAAVLKAGPDFARGRELARVREVWEWCWRSGSEAKLLECSVFGSSLEEVATTRLLAQFEQFERAADRAVCGLVSGCRMGLDGVLPGLLERCRRAIAEDGSLVAVVGALQAAHSLSETSDPLEASQLPGLPQLAEHAYLRASFLLTDLGSSEGPEELLEALRVLAWLAPPGQVLHLDPLERLHDSSPLSELQGAAAGLLYGAGRQSGSWVARALHSRLQAGDPVRAAGYLRGLLACARDVLWQVPEVVDQITGQLENWGEEQFRTALPGLRLGFAALTPSEAHRAAEQVARGLGGTPLSTRLPCELTREDAERALRLEATLEVGLQRDRLLEWIDG